MLHGCRPFALDSPMPAGSESAPIRPSFTAIMWGCSMLMWPRILRHIQSKIDGDISFANMQLPPKVLPFLEAVCALLPKPPALTLSRPSLLIALTHSVYGARAQTMQTLTHGIG